jgi:hypothetical protein
VTLPAIWLTPEAVAERLGVARETVRSRILDESLPAIEVLGPGGQLVTMAVAESDLPRFEARKIGRPRKKDQP